MTAASFIELGCICENDDYSCPGRPHLQDSRLFLSLRLVAFARTTTILALGGLICEDGDRYFGANFLFARMATVFKQDLA